MHGVHGAPNDGIVMHDDDVVLCRMDVELHGIGAPLERAAKGGESILGELARGTPVGDALEAGLALGHSEYIHRRARQEEGA